MPSADKITRAIEPGSLPYGDRKKLGETLKQTGGGGGGGGGGGVPQPGPTAPNSGRRNPMQRLLDGGYSSDLPVTDGIPQGPGAGPANRPSAMAESPRIGKLRMIALEAKSPLLRYYARIALRTEMKNLNG